MGGVPVCASVCVDRQTERVNYLTMLFVCVTRTHPGGCERKGQGRCIQEKKYVTLLCLTNRYRLVFRLFEVDGYCSCRYRYQWQTEAVQFSPDSAKKN